MSSPVGLRRRMIPGLDVLSRTASEISRSASNIFGGSQNSLSEMKPVGKLPEWKVMCMEAEALAKSGENERALMLYHKALRMRPNAQEIKRAIKTLSNNIADSLQSNKTMKLFATMKLLAHKKKARKRSLTGTDTLFEINEEKERATEIPRNLPLPQIGAVSAKKPHRIPSLLINGEKDVTLSNDSIVIDTERDDGGGLIRDRTILQLSKEKSFQDSKPKAPDLTHLVNPPGGKSIKAIPPIKYSSGLGEGKGSQTSLNLFSSPRGQRLKSVSARSIASLGGRSSRSSIPNLHFTSYEKWDLNSPKIGNDTLSNKGIDDNNNKESNHLQRYHESEQNDVEMNKLEIEVPTVANVCETSIVPQQESAKLTATSPRSVRRRSSFTRISNLDSSLHKKQDFSNEGSQERNEHDSSDKSVKENSVEVERGINEFQAVKTNTTEKEIKTQEDKSDILTHKVMGKDEPIPEGREGKRDINKIHNSEAEEKENNDKIIRTSEKRTEAVAKHNRINTLNDSDKIAANNQKANDSDKIKSLDNTSVGRKNDEMEGISEFKGSQRPQDETPLVKPNLSRSNTTMAPTAKLPKGMSSQKTTSHPNQNPKPTNLKDTKNDKLGPKRPGPNAKQDLPLNLQSSLKKSKTSITPRTAYGTTLRKSSSLKTVRGNQSSNTTTPRIESQGSILKQSSAILPPINQQEQNQQVGGTVATVSTEKEVAKKAAKKDSPGKGDYPHGPKAPSPGPPPNARDDPIREVVLKSKHEKKEAKRPLPRKTQSSKTLMAVSRGSKFQLQKKLEDAEGKPLAKMSKEKQDAFKKNCAKAIVLAKSNVAFKLKESEQPQADSRTEDWQQDAPEFLLESTQTLESRSNSPDSSPQQYAMAELKRIQTDYEEERYENARYRSTQVIQHISETAVTEAFTEQEQQNILANVYSCKGNAVLEMGLMDEALECHLKDLRISENNNLLEAKSRALANVGRVHARAGRFRDAIDVWKDKMQLCASSEERAWLFHEMGRCYYQMIEYNDALEAADQSWVNAQETNDTDMQFRASYLMAQCYEKLEALEEALVEYKKALDLAFVSDNEDEAGRIQEALQNLSQKLAKKIAASRQRSKISRSHVENEIGAVTARDINVDSARGSPVTDTYYLTLLYVMATLPEY